MPDEDKKKTVFVTPDGLYKFNGMPFGLPNARATFEKTMDTVLRGLRWKMCLSYLDDTYVYWATFSEHIRRQHVVLSYLATAGLQ